MKSRETKHGHNTRAGQSPTYVTWNKMRGRCCNPNNDNFHNYGGRGIAVCERWSKFEDFLADMGERPEGTELDRIDNDGPYSPENCRWATRSRQMRNTRVTFRAEYQGCDMALSDIAELLGVKLPTLRQRILYNWPEDRWGDAPDKNRYVIPRKGSSYSARGCS